MTGRFMLWPIPAPRLVVVASLKRSDAPLSFTLVVCSIHERCTVTLLQ
jgi:hypothetical protein